LRHIDVRSSNNRVEIQTPVGEIKVSKDATYATGLPVYPHATKGTDDNIVGGSADISLGNQGLGIAAESYEFADSLEAVKRGIAAVSGRVSGSRPARASTRG
jgi:hypothetical protein